MPKIAIVLIALCLTCLQSALGQEENPPAAEEQTDTAVPPIPGIPQLPPRVPGQAQTQAEWDAWQLILQAQDSAEQAELAQHFLETYPESGLKPNAHHLIARHYYQIGDIDNFTLHAEKALEELPELTDLLSQLAFFYAEKGQTPAAIKHANKALEVLESTEMPASASASDWVTQNYQIRAEANYALGRSVLNTLKKDETREATLKKAIEYFQMALNYDPRHDYASFRLGFAHRNSNNVAGALTSYGRAVAIGQVAAAPAQRELEEILEIVKDALPDSEWAKKSADQIIEEANQLLSEELARVQQEKATRVQEIEQLRQPLVTMPGATSNPE